jgi:hypothetical protein
LCSLDYSLWRSVVSERIYMRVSRRIPAFCVAALTAGGAFIATAPAEAAIPGHAGHVTGQPATVEANSGAGPSSTVTQRAGVTDIREILNQRPEQVQFYKGEDRVQFAVAPNSRWAGSMWVPWVGNGTEMSKSITISWGGRIRYWVFQDYWNTTDLVRYSTVNSYQNSLPVPGASTGAGRKRLTVRADGSLFMETSG